MSLGNTRGRAIVREAIGDQALARPRAMGPDHRPSSSARSTATRRPACTAPRYTSAIDRCTTKTVTKLEGPKSGEPSSKKTAPPPAPREGDAPTLADRQLVLDKERTKRFPDLL